MESEINIRFAVASDCRLILKFIKELASYENLLEEVSGTENDLRESLFGPHAHAECLLAFDCEDAVGMALFFHNYSTFLGKSGIYLEDLFVSPEARGRGAGHALLTELARLANERGCGRLEWSVLDWNQPAIDFYQKLGAKPVDGWTVYRLTGEALAALTGVPTDQNDCTK